MPPPVVGMRTLILLLALGLATFAALGGPSPGPEAAAPGDGITVQTEHFNVTTVYAGRITCWAGVTFTAAFQCSASPTVNGALAAQGKGHENLFLIGVGPDAEDPVAGEVSEAWVEAVWEDVRAGSAYAYPPFDMTLVLGNADEPMQERSMGGRGDSLPPARVTAPKGLVDLWGLAEDGTFRFSMVPGSVYGTGLLLDLAYEAHATVYYNGAADPCWSPLLGAKVC